VYNVQVEKKRKGCVNATIHFHCGYTLWHDEAIFFLSMLATQSFQLSLPKMFKTFCCEDQIQKHNHTYLSG